MASYYREIGQESVANAKGSVRQKCMYKGP